MHSKNETMLIIPIVNYSHVLSTLMTRYFFCEVWQIKIGKHR